ncbi:glycosyltransferase family 61 protein [Rhizobium sp. R86522]|uniref:glycosyltransferase family 61 protein n=1 Tax=Rhizobium sp. R86522 TaxID=3093861 RepID=UPI00366A8AA8
MRKTTANLQIVTVPGRSEKEQGKNRLILHTKLFIVGVYRRYLKKIPPVRYVAIRIWKVGYPAYLRATTLLSFDREIAKWRPLVSFSQYQEPQALASVKLLDAVSVKTDVPTVLPVKDQHFVSRQEGYDIPDVTVRVMDQGTISGGTNLLQFANKVVCHDLFDLKRDYTSEELHGRALISVRKSKLRFRSRDLTPLRLPEAAPFVDACAPNYAHWLTEVLPRLALFCTNRHFSGIPIVIDSGLHDNILESIAFFTAESREIYALPIGRSITAEKVYVTSATGYVPFERRSGSGAHGHSQGRFHPAAFALIRNVVIPVAVSETTTQEFSKIYIRRNSGTRRVLNSSELEQALVERGYAIIEPEKLNFIDQVKIFARAKTIVGSSGAALANIIFANTSANIYIMIGRHQGTSFWYWQNIATAVGCGVNYVFGEIEATAGAAIHADFRIDIPQFLSELDLHDAASAAASPSSL